MSGVRSTSPEPGPMSHAQMRALGWERIDERPWSKIGARWRHTSGWRLAHCGHATAIRPWALIRPDGHMVCTGVLHDHPPNFGTAWTSLRMPVEWLARFLASGSFLRAEEGAPHIFGGDYG